MLWRKQSLSRVRRWLCKVYCVVSHVQGRHKNSSRWCFYAKTNYLKSTEFRTHEVDGRWALDDIPSPRIWFSSYFFFFSVWQGSHKLISNTRGFERIIADRYRWGERAVRKGNHLGRKVLELCEWEMGGRKETDVSRWLRSRVIKLADTGEQVERKAQVYTSPSLTS